MSLSPDGELFFVPAAAGTFLFRTRVIDGSESDVAHHPRRRRRRDRQPAPDRRPRRRRRSPRRHEDGVRAAERRRPRRRRDRPDRLDAAPTGLESRGGAGPRLPGHRRRRRADPRAVPLHASPTAAPIRSAAASSCRSADTPLGRPGAGRPARHHRAARRRHGVRAACSSTTTTPKAARCDVVGVARRRAATLRIGPGLGRRVFVTVDADELTGFSFGYDVVDEAGNRNGVVRPGAPRARRARPTGRRSPGPTSPAHGRRAGHDPRARQRHRSRRRRRAARVDRGPAGVRHRRRQPRRHDHLHAARRPHAATDRLRYVVVDAFGERAIGEVLIGVMPLDGANHPPERGRRRVHGRRRQRPDRPRRARQRLRRRRRPACRHPRQRAPRHGRASPTRDARHVPARRPTSPAERRPAVVTFTYAIDDGRGGIDDGDGHDRTSSPRCSPSPDRASTTSRPGPARRGRHDRRARQRPRPRRRTSRLTLHRSVADPGAHVRPGDRVATITAGTATSEHSYTVTDPSGLTATGARDASSSPTTSRRPSHHWRSRRRPGSRSRSTLGDQVDRPRRRRAVLRLLRRRRAAGAPTTDIRRRRQLVRRRSCPTRTSPAWRRSPTPSTTSTGTRVAGSVAVKVLAPANRPPVGDRRRRSRWTPGPPGPSTSRRSSRDPDPGDTLRFDHGSPAAGAVQLAGAARPCASTAAIEAAGRRGPFGYTATDAGGESAAGTVTINVTPPPPPPPEARRRRRRPHQPGRRR